MSTWKKLVNALKTFLEFDIELIIGPEKDYLISIKINGRNLGYWIVSLLVILAVLHLLENHQ